jgi:hypothetical protein
MSTPRSPEVEELTARLEEQCLRVLASEWSGVNALFFGGRLRRPQFALVRERARLGFWDRGSRTLAIAHACVLEHPWPVVVDVLKHEMAHQYVDEVEGVFGETAHGPRFRDVCARLGIDPRASGTRPREASDDDRVIEKVARLLALAGRAAEHEAEAAMTAARRLMLKHNVEAPPARRDYGTRVLGEPKGRTTEHERRVGALLGAHFFVEVIWVPVYVPKSGKRAHVLEIAGTEANLAMAEYAFAFVHRASEDAWRAHKRAEGIRGNADRRAFLAGVVSGFHKRLDDDARATREEGLVWVGDADLHRFFRDRHPRVVHVRRGSQAGREAFGAGHAEGRKLVLHRPIGEASATSRGRLLGPGSR